MSNIDAPFGLKPVSNLTGMQLEKCYVSASYDTALFPGDPVDVDPTLTDKDDTAVHQTVEAASAGNGEYIYGVIVSIEPNRGDLSKQYIPASTGGYVYVCADPYAVFTIRDDGAAAPTDVFPGQNANLIATHAGSTVTGLSGFELDTNSDAPAADASNQLLIKRLANIEDNELGAHAIWEVTINLHRKRSTGDGDGSLGVTSA